MTRMEYYFYAHRAHAYSDYRNCKCNRNEYHLALLFRSFQPVVDRFNSTTKLLLNCSPADTKGGTSSPWQSHQFATLQKMQLTIGMASLPRVQLQVLMGQGVSIPTFAQQTFQPTRIRQLPANVLLFNPNGRILSFTPCIPRTNILTNITAEGPRPK